MLPNYERPAFTPQPKQAKAARIIEKREQRAEVKTHERKEKAAARKVAPGCRWPKSDHESPRHVCIGQLEAAHGTAVGIGGDKNGSRTNRRDLLVVCSLIHLGDTGLERHGRKWEPLTERGALGPVAFYKREPSETRPGEWGEWVLIAVESSPGVLAK